MLKKLECTIIREKMKEREWPGFVAYHASGPITFSLWENNLCGSYSQQSRTSCAVNTFPEKLDKSVEELKKIEVCISPSQSEKCFSPLWNRRLLFSSSSVQSKIEEWNISVHWLWSYQMSKLLTPVSSFMSCIYSISLRTLLWNITEKNENY